ncbi:hypothetical protein PoB_003528600 [Plakobranchus ocellatus]|uniref:Uncharacterized protein n=1 Tax=Plakobranchus ocellatus TaxID=259542 RepID=A0AAV4AKF7_9GAST|nr:hypothetical protein PoB_003528600 [Plakobranchus ocellatus]
MKREREIILAATVVVCCATACLAFDCKFPNEGCERNDDCCSKKCVDAHPGTNARCTKLGMHRPCLYTYQCEDRLRCGINNTCCAKYWGICKDAVDCCDPSHKCYEVDGFYYKRCLFTPSVADGISSVSTAHHILVCSVAYTLARTLLLALVR